MQWPPFKKILQTLFLSLLCSTMFLLQSLGLANSHNITYMMPCLEKKIVFYRQYRQNTTTIGCYRSSKVHTVYLMPSVFTDYRIGRSSSAAQNQTIHHTYILPRFSLSMASSISLLAWPSQDRAMEGRELTPMRVPLRRPSVLRRASRACREENRKQRTGQSGGISTRSWQMDTTITG